jgi:hypothetical protein
MNKASKDNLKKSTMLVSTIAILLMVTIISTRMNISAFNIGLLSKDTNIGSIDTSSLFNCVGAAITCDNDNTANNSINQTSSPLTPPNLTCEECIANAGLDEIQLNTLRSVFELTLGASIAEICAEIESLTAAEFIAILVEDVGLSINAANALVECLGLT